MAISALVGSYTFAVVATDLHRINRHHRLDSAHRISQVVFSMMLSRCEFRHCRSERTSHDARVHVELVAV